MKLRTKVLAGIVAVVGIAVFATVQSNAATAPAFSCTNTLSTGLSVGVVTTRCTVPNKTQRVTTTQTDIVTETATVTVTPSPSDSSSSSDSSPSPTPTDSSSAPPGPDQPPAAGVPPNVTLTPYTGPWTISQNGTSLDGYSFGDQLFIDAQNVTISNSLFNSGSFYDILMTGGSLTLTHSTLTNASAAGLAGDNYTASYVELTGLSNDGFKLGSNVHVDHAWCHDNTPAADAHADCGQMQGGETNLTVTDSWLVGGDNSALFLSPDLGPSSNGPVTITNNVLGGGNYTLYCVDGNNGQYVVGNITISGNRFMRGARYGPADINVPVASSGNVWFDDGLPVGNGLN